jgi:hypothetical protein
MNADVVFGFPGELIVSIPDNPPFFSLYSDGPAARTTYLKHSKTTLMAYPRGVPLVLYYTYPAHRAASLVRNLPGRARFPGLSRTVQTLFTVHASRVDKLRRALGFLNKHSGGAFRFDDGFYTRLYFILLRRGKLDYQALHLCAVHSATQSTLMEETVC